MHDAEPDYQPVAGNRPQINTDPSQPKHTFPPRWLITGWPGADVISDASDYSYHLGLLVFTCVVIITGVTGMSRPDISYITFISLRCSPILFSTMFGLFNLAILGFTLWVPIPKESAWARAILGSTLFGLWVWLYYSGLCYLMKEDGHEYPYDPSVISAWHTGSAPQSFTGCEARVEPQQSLLFTPEIYWTQFPRIVQVENFTFAKFDPGRSLNIRSNQTLCYQGFAGNEDLYGMGIRIGIYLQWFAALLVNNLLPEGRKEVQKVYLIFNMALCAATYILSFIGSCVFGIEIEILYWLYWGGFISVFASSPSRTRLKIKRGKWIGLDWKTAIQYTTNVLMAYHAIWFVWLAYDQVFSRMPCGTYQFLFAPVLDPSKTFCFLRDLLMQPILPLAGFFVLLVPILVFFLASEIMNSIHDSALCQ